MWCPIGQYSDPLFFNLYTNDITSVCENAKFIIYADDTNTFISSSSYANLFTMSNNFVCDMSHWSTENCLRVNTVKIIKSPIFHTKGTNLSSDQASLYRPTNIELVHTVMVLGTHSINAMQWGHVCSVLEELSHI